MNKKVNKTTSRRDQLKLNAVIETAADNVSHHTGDSYAQNTVRSKNQQLAKHNPDLSESADAAANVTDEDEILAR